MEYTPMEKDVLAMMQRTDFKNLSKGDVISFASKIGELRPEVAKEVLAQFPEFVGLMKSALTEYKGMLDTIVSSDDASIKEYMVLLIKRWIRQQIVESSFMIL